jgi:hypothetical protein
MATYGRKVRKPLRSLLINLLNKVDDPEVQILRGEGEQRAGTYQHPDERGQYWVTKRNGTIYVDLSIELYDPRQDDEKKGS